MVNNKRASHLFPKQKPLDFCFCLIQLCSKGATLKNCRKKESDLYNKRHEAVFHSASLCFLQFTFWRAVRMWCQGWAGAGAGRYPWHLGLSWVGSCAPTHIHCQALPEDLNKDISEGWLIRLPILLSQIENLGETLQKNEHFSWPRHKLTESLHLRCLNLWGWTRWTHMSCSGSV